MLRFLTSVITVTKIMTPAAQSTAKASIPKLLPLPALPWFDVDDKCAVVVTICGLGSRTTIEAPPDSAMVTGADRLAPSIVAATTYFVPGVRSEKEIMPLELVFAVTE